MIPEEVVVWLNQQGYGYVSLSTPLGGGCINNGVRLETERGKTFFLKTNCNNPEDMFLREAQGLAELASGEGPRTPLVYLSGRDFLLLEDLAPAPPVRDYWELFGRQMAALHDRSSGRFGFTEDNYIGSTLQPNPWTDSGFEFFGEQRLNFQAGLAAKRGLLDPVEVRRVEGISARLPELVPEQPVSLLHGDLWSGNAISDDGGLPAVIDPAVYYGWAEADLAMTALFGGFSQVFYDAYIEARPLAAGWRDRFPVYNLYHLLNHLNLFGSGYYRQVIDVVQRFG